MGTLCKLHDCFEKISENFVFFSEKRFHKKIITSFSWTFFHLKGFDLNYSETSLWAPHIELKIPKTQEQKSFTIFGKIYIGIRYPPKIRQRLVDILRCYCLPTYRSASSLEGIFSPLVKKIHDKQRPRQSLESRRNDGNQAFFFWFRKSKFYFSL